MDSFLQQRLATNANCIYVGYIEQENQVFYQVFSQKAEMKSVC